MPTIKKPNQYFDATTYTASASYPRTITNAGGMQPDLVWIKSRTQAYSHYLFDSVRGTGAKGLSSNLTSAEGADAGTSISSFNSNGYTISAGDAISDTSAVAWQWKAGGTSTVNTSGTISSNVSVNTTAGFSIVTYAGTLTSAGVATVGHGLGVAPKMIISKSLGTSQWVVQHTSLTSPSYFLYLNTTDAQDNKAGNGTMSAPTSTVFSTNWTTGLNVSGSNHVAYCWAEIAGFSAFGSYTGNGSADGPFVYLGFRPKFVMFKRTDTTGNWRLIDTARYTYNTMGNELYPNSSAAEAYNAFYDVLSNGFKMRNTNADLNASGGTFIYAAFAEAPFKYANAR